MPIIRFKDHLQEAKSKDQRAECERIFEKYVMGFERSEMNTPKEDEIAYKLDWWLNMNAIRPGTLEAFKKLKECQKQYPKALDPKNGDLAWRGKEWNSKSSNPEEAGFDYEYVMPKSMGNRVLTRKGQKFYVSEKFEYTPHRPLQSWTTNWVTATDFSTSDYGLILETWIDDDFVLTPQFSNKMFGLKEYEVVRVSKSPITVRAYVPVESYENWVRQFNKMKRKKK